MSWGTSPELAQLLDGLQHPGLKSIDLSLGRMERLLDALGNPQNQLPPVVHVAGTNGKGSLVAYLRAMFEAVGQHTHVYTSPHLVRFHERIVLAGKEVADASLKQALQRIDDLQATHPATFFEATTAAAFCLFAQTQADVCLLEVGLGGRLDATNVVQRPAITAITPISIDHAEFLGDTLPAIAREKAGIMKPQVPCVIGPQQPEALAVLEAYAQEIGAPLWRCGVEWQLQQHGAGWRYISESRQIDIPQPVLVGAHQWANAATAIACMDAASYFERDIPKIDETAVRRGVETAHWPGRMQRLHRPSWLAALPEGSEVWLDGGHNPAAATILANWAQEQVLPVHLICGMRSSKDARQFLAELAGHVASVCTVPIPDEPACVAPETLCETARAVGVEQAKPAHSLADALRNITEDTGKKPVCVLIAGSLYLAGAVLAEGEQ